MGVELPRNTRTRTPYPEFQCSSLKFNSRKFLELNFREGARKISQPEPGNDLIEFLVGIVFDDDSAALADRFHGDFRPERR